MATVKEVFALLVTADGKAAVAELGKLGDAAERDLGRGVKEAEKLNKQMLAMSAGVATAGAATIAALKATSNEYVANGREVMKLQRVTGAAAEETSGLRFAAAQSGVGVDQLSTALVRLSRAQESNNGKRALAQLGVDLRDANGQARPIVDVLNEVADGVNRLQGGDEKNNLVTAIFGRGGADLLPLLNKGSGGIADLAAQAERLGLVFTSDDLANVKEMVQAQKDLASARQSLANVVGREVTPHLAAAEAGIADAATAAVERLEALPDSLKAALAQLAVVGGGGATLLGGAGALAAGLNDTSEAAGRVRDALRAGQLSMVGLAAGSAAVVVGAVAWSTAIDGVVAQYERARAEATRLSDIQQTLASQDPTNNTSRLLGLQTAEQLLGRQDGVFLDEMNPWEKLQSGRGWAGAIGAGARGLGLPIPFLDETAVKLRLSKDLLAALKQELQALPLENAQQRLADIAEGFDFQGATPQEIKEFLDPLRELIAERERAENATKSHSLEEWLRGVGAAAKANADAFDRGPSIREVMGDMLDLADSHDRLADAQRRQQEALTSNNPAVISAYENLSRAHQRLNDLLEDQNDTLSQISPEEGIRRARARLKEANAILANDPRNADALTKKDEAIADIDRESERRQELRRTERQRGRALRDANADVAGAQKAYDDAVSKTGVNSREYQAATRDVVRAHWEIEEGVKDLAKKVLEGQMTLEEFRAEMKRLQDEGFLTGDAVAYINREMSTLAGLAASAEGIARLTASITAGASLRNFGALAGAAASFTRPGRSLGGDVNVGQLYRVNESAEEYFQANVPGRVLTPLHARGLTNRPHTGTASTMPATSTTHEEHLHLHEVLRPRDAVDVAVREQRKRAYLFGGVSRSR